METMGEGQPRCLPAYFNCWMTLHEARRDHFRVLRAYLADPGNPQLQTRRQQSLQTLKQALTQYQQAMWEYREDITSRMAALYSREP